MISLCITTYNRFELLFESFAQVLDDERISEIVIVDDCSDASIFNKVCIRVGELNWKYPKIKMFRNENNLGCYKNKREAVSKASNEWVILLDSDNVIDKIFVDTLYGARFFQGGDSWLKSVAYNPSFAKPHFDFRQFGDRVYNFDNVHTVADNPTFTTGLNAMNYFVNRDEFLRVFEDRSEPWTADSILINYNWLNAGNEIYFCPGLEYYHRIDGYGKENGSHYKENYRKTGSLYDNIVTKLKNMR